MKDHGGNFNWLVIDNGAAMLDETGSSLNEIVCRLQRMDSDFGHTDMELEVHLPDGTIKFVEDTVSRIFSLINDTFTLRLVVCRWEVHLLIPIA